MHSSSNMVREIVVRYRGSAKQAGEVYNAPDKAAKFFRGVVAGDSREHFMALYLDSRNKPLTYRIVSIGTTRASLVHPREVFQPALLIGACSIIVAHNHPSGDPQPSNEDRNVTERLIDVGKVIGIELLDSIVVTEDSFVSFKERAPSLFTYK